MCSSSLGSSTIRNALNSDDIVEQKKLSEWCLRQAFLVALYWVRNTSVADEVAVNAVAKIFDSYHDQFNPHKLGAASFKSSFKAWLYTVSRNEALDHKRKEQCRNRVRNRVLEKLKLDEKSRSKTKAGSRGDEDDFLIHSEADVDDVELLRRKLFEEIKPDLMRNWQKAAEKEHSAEVLRRVRSDVGQDHYEVFLMMSYVPKPKLKATEVAWALRESAANVYKIRLRVLDKLTKAKRDG